MRIGFKTTLKDNLISDIKIIAIKNNVNVNDIIEELFEKLLLGEIQIDFKKLRK